MVLLISSVFFGYPEEYFTYMTVANIMVGGKRAGPEENP